MEVKNYAEWEMNVPAEIQADSVWRMRAYRLALFLSDLCWHDATRLMQDRRTLGLSDQLFRAVGSIGANLAEGYSRNGSRDRARFYEYALGSARESRDWYYKGRMLLGDEVVSHRIEILSQIIKLLLTMIPDQANHHLREESAEYLEPTIDTDSTQPDISLPD